MASRYYGGKSEKYVESILPLLPDDGIHRFVDCFFGMGNATRQIPCRMINTKVVAYEKERGLYTLHEVIKDDVLLEELKGKINDVVNTKDYFQHSMDIIKAYNSRENDFSKVDVALAELVAIRFSRNSARNSYRNPKSYEGRGYDVMTMTKKRRVLESICEKFYNQMPLELMEMNYKWKNIQLFNDDCMNHIEKWGSNENFIFIDPPYLPNKRGLKEKNDKKPVNRGYLEDMSADEHNIMIDKIIKTSNAGAKYMICSNFEIDDRGNLIGVTDDPYTRLLQHGFRMVVVKKCYSTAIITEKNIKSPVKQKKKPKVEVVYINYTNIIGTWELYKYIDYADVINNNGSKQI